jgi:hypothetical protein
MYNPIKSLEEVIIHVFSLNKLIPNLLRAGGDKF